MSDNITAPAAGAILATDDVGGVQYPRVKVTYGPDGTATDVSPTNPLPVGDAASQPATQAFAIATNDTTALATIPRAIYVGGAGDIALRASGSGADVTLKAVPAGSLIPLRAQYVRATGTTATSLVGLA